MREGPYHHGNLRPALLAAAGARLREHGTEQISLRELARETGVSKSAPHRHFRDKDALLDALAVDGFDRLAEEIGRAVARAGRDPARQLRSAAGAFVGFAAAEPALLDLMFARAKTAGRDEVAAAADRVYATIGELVRRGQDAGELPSGQADRVKLLLTATLQGIATLASSGRVPVDQTSTLIDDALDLFSEHARRAGDRLRAARPGP